MVDALMIYLNFLNASNQKIKIMNLILLFS